MAGEEIHIGHNDRSGLRPSSPANTFIVWDARAGDGTLEWSENQLPHSVEIGIFALYMIEAGPPEADSPAINACICGTTA